MKNAGGFYCIRKPPAMPGDIYFDLLIIKIP